MEALYLSNLGWFSGSCCHLALLYRFAFSMPKKASRINCEHAEIGQQKMLSSVMDIELGVVKNKHIF